MTQPIFLGYDRVALDREYNNRGKVPSFADYLARYPKASEAARRDLPCRLDLQYGPAASERLDVFLPAGAGPAPILVFAHGGYWMALDKADFDFVARAFAPAGVMVVVINYGLIPSVDMDELVRQCRASVAWVYRNAAALGGDPARIFAAGHSAGGHIAVMLLATDWPAFGELPADLVKGATGMSGLYDLEPIRLCYLNETLTLTPEVARRHSPVRLRPPGRAPLLLAVGDAEGPEYHRQTGDLATAWRGHGVPCEVMDMTGIDHFSIVCELEEPGSRLARAIRRQMGLPS